MKVRNLFFGLSVAVALTACSNDDNITPEFGEVDAYLSLMATEGTMKTKADDNAKDKEAIIHQLTALVFNSAGNVIAVKDTIAPNDLASIDRITHIKVKIKDHEEGDVSETPLTIVLVANAHDIVKTATTLTQFKTALTTLDITNYPTIGGSYLPMVSPVYTKEGFTKDKENWITTGTVIHAETHDPLTNPTYGVGEIIPMTRLVARVELVSLLTNFTGTYAGAHFFLTKTHLANVRANSRFAVDSKGYYENTSAALYTGFQTVNVIDDLINPAADTYKSMFEFPVPYKPQNISDNPAQPTTSYGGGWTGPLYTSYMFENQFQDPASYATRIVLEGTITLANGQDLGTKFFHIVLRETNKTNPAIYNYVTANTIYRISATITGEGSGEEDEILANACIAAKVEILPWTVVTQNETDVN